MNYLVRQMIRCLRKFSQKIKAVWQIFLKCILHIPDNEFGDLEFLGTHTRKDSALDGGYILDIKVKTGSNIIDVEM